MTSFTAADELHRLVKQTLDSGAAASLEEAKAQFLSYRLCFLVDEVEAMDRDHQAALLTGIALARRVFLGGVDVVGPLDAALRVPMPLGNTLAEAVRKLGGRVIQVADPSVPCVRVGGVTRARSANFDLRMVFSGWRGGVVPAHAEFTAGEPFTAALAPMLAAAFAVSEAFFHVQGQLPSAGRRSVGLSLWDLSRQDWLAPELDSPPLRYLPSSLWLIGLGHLGQAYLWALGLLPYPKPSKSTFVLQDIDIITPSTFSTSILTEADMAGEKKTREIAVWAKARGFDTIITERKFDLLCKRAEDEAAVALCGLDNAFGRQVLDQTGFSFVVESGLGRGHRDFRTMRLHTLPGSRPASEIWNTPADNDDLSGQAAYQKMLNDGELDRCGITLLAGKAVGAPFVGAIAACLAVGEVLRLLHGGVTHELIDLDLKGPEHRYLVLQKRDFSSFNPGYIAAAGL